MGTHRFSIDGRRYEVEVGPRSGRRVDVVVNGATYRVELEEPGAAPAPAARPAPAAPPPPPAFTPVRSVSLAGTTGEVRAPISGLVLSVEVSPGQQVAAGSVLLVLEAMKMENEIFAPQDGTVERVAVAAQQDVAQGDLLLTLA